MKKRFWAILLAVCMLVSLLPISALAAGDGTKEGTCGENVTWALDDSGVLTISGTGAMADYDEIDAPWTPYIKSIHSVVIQPGVTDIGICAFYNCTNLKSVSLPKGLLTIGAWAFRECSALTSVEIPDGVTTIYGLAFTDCTSLSKVKMPKSVIYLEDSIFSGCNFKSAGPMGSGSDFEFGWTDSIPEGAFLWCDSLTSVKIPSTVKSIGDGAFLFCTGLKSITIPAGVTTIGDLAFAGCDSLTSIALPKGMTKINNALFSGCIGLKNVTIPEGVKSIGEGAFEECENLVSITIPVSIRSIRDGAFFLCDSLEKVYYGGTPGSWYSISMGADNESLDFAEIHCAKPDEKIEAPGVKVVQGANIYSGPKNSAVKLGSIKAGTPVDIVQKYFTPTWHLVWYDGQYGFIWAGYFVKPKTTGTMTTAQGTSIYSAPKNTSSKLGSVKAGTKVEIVKKNYTSTWHQVWYNGMVGYIWAGYMKPVATATTAQGAYIYSAPKNTSSKLGNIAAGTKISILKKNYTSTWHQVLYNGKIGYIWVGNLKPEIVATATTAQGTYIYSAPKNTSSKLGNIAAGTKVEIIKKNYTSTWHQVWYNGKTGYVWIGNLKPEIAATATTARGAYIYSEPKNTSSKLGNIAAGTKVEIIKKNYTSTWHQIWYNGKVAYIWQGNF